MGVSFPERIRPIPMRIRHEREAYGGFHIEVALYALLSAKERIGPDG